ncbi:D-mannonate oxidoreductase [Budvicia aquatica]|uniref:D-mannonate oxidoreductase n=1 Tax=Budvicia aquatica TaxID=82979 RepID=A0A484ZB22_9GAMM|nr:D-mannonate oxidoreductase [Budvicia aquatica]
MTEPRLNRALLIWDLALSTGAHQAVYADQLASRFGSDWGFCEINLIGGEQQISDLNAQDCLYSVAEMASEGWSGRVVGVVCQAIHGETDGIDRVLQAMSEPELLLFRLPSPRKAIATSRQPER